MTKKKQKPLESLMLFDNQEAFDDDLPNEKRKFILSLCELFPSDFYLAFISALTCAESQKEFVDQLVLAALLRSKEIKLDQETQGRLFADL